MFRLFKLVRCFSWVVKNYPLHHAVSRPNWPNETTLTTQGCLITSRNFWNNLFLIRYEDLQSVSLGTIDYPTTSCSVMSSGGLANGAEPGSMALPTARLPPRLVAKDVWPQGPEVNREQSQPQDQSWNSSRDRGPDVWTPGRDRPQEQVWNSGRDRVGHSSQDQTWIPGRERPDQAWMTGRDRAPEQNWATSRDRGQDQGWNAGRDPGRDRASSGPEQGWGTGQSQDQTWSNTSRDREHVWRPGGYPHTLIVSFLFSFLHGFRFKSTSWRSHSHCQISIFNELQL